MTTKELEVLIKMLKKNGVFHYIDGDLELKITPTTMQDVKIPSKSTKEVNEDDLYYSANTLKPKAK
jgi:hypothetical protein